MYKIPKRMDYSRFIQNKAQPLIERFIREKQAGLESQGIILLIVGGMALAHYLGKRASQFGDSIKKDFDIRLMYREDWEDKDADKLNDVRRRLALELVAFLEKNLPKYVVEMPHLHKRTAIVEMVGYSVGVITPNEKNFMNKRKNIEDYPDESSLKSLDDQMMNSIEKNILQHPEIQFKPNQLMVVSLIYRYIIPKIGITYSVFNLVDFTCLDLTDWAWADFKKNLASINLKSIPFVKSNGIYYPTYEFVIFDTYLMLGNTCKEQWAMHAAASYQDKDIPINFEHDEDTKHERYLDKMMKLKDTYNLFSRDFTPIEESLGIAPEPIEQKKMWDDFGIGGTIKLTKGRKSRRKLVKKSKNRKRSKSRRKPVKKSKNRSKSKRRNKSKRRSKSKRKLVRSRRR